MESGGGGLSLRGSMDGKGGDGEILPMFESIGQANTLVTFLSMLWITQKFLQIMNEVSTVRLH